MKKSSEINAMSFLAIRIFRKSVIQKVIRESTNKTQSQMSNSLSE